MFEKPFMNQGQLLEIGEALADDIERAEKERIDIETFRGVLGFSDAEIDEDLAYEQKTEEAHRKLNADDRRNPLEKIQRTAHIIELVLPMAIHDYGWLGKDTHIIYASRYDDTRNHVDSAAQMIKRGIPANLGFEIDFTSSEAEMADKIKMIGAEAEIGKVSLMKYFDSPTTGKVRNQRMPRIAFGVPMKEMANFSDLLVESRKNPGNDTTRKALENHPLKKKFLTYTANQLREFGRLAARSGNPGYARLHEEVLEAMKSRGLIK